MKTKEAISLNELFDMPKFKGIKRVIGHYVEWY